MPIAALTADQQNLAMQLIQQVCTPDGFARLTRGRDDDSGGWKHDHIAVFGSPDGPDPFEWVVTGRHLTLRGTTTGVIRGGPLFLGHSTPGAGSIWHEPANLANRLDRSLNLSGMVEAGHEPSVPLVGLNPGQRAIVRQLLASLTGSFWSFAAPAIAACFASARGLDRLTWEAHPSDPPSSSSPLLAWRLSGPGFRWSFHAQPHVHSWFDSA